MTETLKSEGKVQSSLLQLQRNKVFFIHKSYRYLDGSYQLSNRFGQIPKLDTRSMSQ